MLAFFRFNTTVLVLWLGFTNQITAKVYLKFYIKESLYLAKGDFIESLVSCPEVCEMVAENNFKKIGTEYLLQILLTPEILQSNANYLVEYAILVEDIELENGLRQIEDAPWTPCFLKGTPYTSLNQNSLVVYPVYFGDMNCALAVVEEKSLTQSQQITFSAGLSVVGQYGEELNKFVDPEKSKVEIMVAKKSKFLEVDTYIQFKDYMLPNGEKKVTNDFRVSINEDVQGISCKFWRLKNVNLIYTDGNITVLQFQVESKDATPSERPTRILERLLSAKKTGYQQIDYQV